MFNIKQLTCKEYIENFRDNKVEPFGLFIVKNYIGNIAVFSLNKYSHEIKSFKFKFQAKKWLKQKYNEWRCN